MSSGTQTTAYAKQPIDRFVDAADAADGVDIRALRPGDTLEVRTCHSRYRLAVHDPEGSRVVAVGDGAYLSEESPARVIGSSLTGRGTLVKSGWVLVGFKLLLSVEDGELLTSRVRHLALNGRSLTAVRGVH